MEADQRPSYGVQAAFESRGKAILLGAAEVCRGLGLRMPLQEKLQQTEIKLAGNGCNTIILQLDRYSRLELCNSELIGLDQGNPEKIGGTSSERVVAQWAYSNDMAVPVNVVISNMETSTHIQAKSKTLQVSASSQVSANTGCTVRWGAGSATAGFTVSYNLRTGHTMGEQDQRVQGHTTTSSMNFVVPAGQSVLIDRVQINSQTRHWHVGSVQLVGNIKLISTRSTRGTYWRNVSRVDKGTQDQTSKGLCSWAFPKAFEYTFGADWPNKPPYERVQCEVTQDGRHRSYIAWDAALKANQDSKEFQVALKRLQNPASWECKISGHVEVETCHTRDYGRVTHTRVMHPGVPAAAGSAGRPTAATQPAAAAAQAAGLQPTGPVMPPHPAAATQPIQAHPQQVMAMLAPGGMAQPVLQQVVPQVTGHNGCLG